MSSITRKREVGRGERVMPGIWRLRLPLPWPGVPHCNAWAVAAGDGIVLFDTGMNEPGSLAHLERALAQVNLKLDHVRLLVCTHAHSDHYGQAASIVERSGCELWMHPDHRHQTEFGDDPDAALERRIEVARQSGVPAEPLAAYRELAKGRNTGVKKVVLPDRELTDGMTVTTDLGDWRVYETPGHAPSHVCLHQPERRLLISGDHLLGRVSIFYEHGWSPDPVGEFLSSLDVVEQLDVRLCLSGHGRTFTDVQAHIETNRRLVGESIDRHIAVLREEECTAFEAVARVHAEAVTPDNANWWLSETLCYLEHLEATGRASRTAGGDEAADRWTLTG
jgi:glyoxylase-like metal-dependent hydrolase (beta-lactamase superfamily II)